MRSTLIRCIPAIRPEHRRTHDVKRFPSPANNPIIFFFLIGTEPPQSHQMSLRKRRLLVTESYEESDNGDEPSAIDQPSAVEKHLSLDYRRLSFTTLWY